MMILDNEDATLDIGRKLGALLRPGDKIALSGTLGAGKTTLARGILQGLDYGGEVPSPTFAIVQSYEPPETRLPVAHIDLYRIEDPEEIPEDGFWQDALNLTLEITAEGNRRLTWQAGNAWNDRWPLT